MKQTSPATQQEGPRLGRLAFRDSELYAAHPPRGTAFVLQLWVGVAMLRGFRFKVSNEQTLPQQLVIGVLAHAPAGRRQPEHVARHQKLRHRKHDAVQGIECRRGALRRQERRCQRCG